MTILHPGQLLLGLAASAAVAGIAYAARALTVSGALAALIVGTLIFGIGGWFGAAALLTFFVTSSALSRWRHRAKEALGFEKTGRRDAAQVWANGGVAVLCLLLPLLPLGMTNAHARLMFLAALAAANADTWATEVGAAFGGVPFLITTGKRVTLGTSGGVSVPGLAAALAGAALMASFAGAWRGALIVTMAGWTGALFDSLLGATVQAQWVDSEGQWSEAPAPRPPEHGLRGMNNDLVNTLCTLFAAGLTFCLLSL